LAEGLMHKGLRVIAVDRSKAMIEVMRRKFPNAPIDYCLGDAEGLPIEDGGVDYSFANMLLHHVERPWAAIGEMARILRPGGALVVADLDEHDFGFLKIEHKDLWMGFRRGEVERWLLEAGLEGVSIRCAGENCCAKSSSGGERASIRIFIASGKKRGPARADGTRDPWAELPGTPQAGGGTWPGRLGHPRQGRALRSPWHWEGHQPD
jgi:SAM-dependent methyltransferase